MMADLQVSNPPSMGTGLDLLEILAIAAQGEAIGIGHGWTGGHAGTLDGSVDAAIGRHAAAIDEGAPTGGAVIAEADGTILLPPGAVVLAGCEGIDSLGHAVLADRPGQDVPVSHGPGGARGIDLFGSVVPAEIASIPCDMSRLRHPGLGRADQGRPR